MIDAIKTIVLDFQDVVLETGVPRHLVAEPVPNKATVCIGVRRCGKSTYMYQRMQHLMDTGVPKENLLYVNFFDDRLHNLKKDGLGLSLSGQHGIIVYGEQPDGISQIIGLQGAKGGCFGLFGVV